MRELPSDSHGHTQGRKEAKEEFKRTDPTPADCDHSEVDQIVPLSKGGHDDPLNRQWLSQQQRRRKTRVVLGYASACRGVLDQRNVHPWGALESAKKWLRRCPDSYRRKPRTSMAFRCLVVVGISLDGRWLWLAVGGPDGQQKGKS